MVDRAFSQPVTEPCGLNFAGLKKLSDEAVMAHLKAGHSDALAVLFDRYHRLVLSIAYKILRDLSEAEDTMQSVFLEIFRVSAQFNPAKGTTKVWLLQYAYHRSLNRRQYLRIRNFYDATHGGAIEEAEEQLSPRASLPLAPVETREFLRQGLRQISAVQRRTLELAYFEGLSLREIAERTGESLGNVRHHYYRGLSHLRSVLLERNEKESGNVAARGTVDAEA
jgi:RNA polymerase sigma-70 factor, ECF subfamily